MKNLLLIIALIVSGSFVTVSANDYKNINPVNVAEQIDFVQGVGTVILKGDIWIIRVTRNNEIIDYAPLNLPKSYQHVGLVVKFSGQTKVISDTNKLAGITLVISQIKLVK